MKIKLYHKGKALLKSKVKHCQHFLQSREDLVMFLIKKSLSLTTFRYYVSMYAFQEKPGRKENNHSIICSSVATSYIVKSNHIDAGVQQSQYNLISHTVTGGGRCQRILVAVSVQLRLSRSKGRSSSMILLS